jgi:hypothetical protein
VNPFVLEPFLLNLVGCFLTSNIIESHNYSSVPNGNGQLPRNLLAE